MVFASALIAVTFGFLAGVLIITAIRARDEDIPFGSMLGLPGPAVRKSLRTWNQVHKNAVPYFWAAAAIAAIQALAAGAAMSVPGIGSPGYLVAITLTGLVLIFGLLLLAPRK